MRGKATQRTEPLFLSSLDFVSTTKERDRLRWEGVAGK